jgi:uncharacterized protein YciI
MYAIAVIRYRKPLEEVIAATDEHRAHLRSLKALGLLLASGPLEPRNGGILLFRVPDSPDSSKVLDQLRDDDPFVKKGVAQYEWLVWAPTIGKDDLDKLSPPPSSIT